MITQRKLDEMHVNAEERAQRIKENFLRGLQGGRGASINAQEEPQPIQEVSPSPEIPMARNGENQLPQVGQETNGGVP